MKSKAEEVYQKLQSSHYAKQKGFIKRWFHTKSENHLDVIQLRLQLIDAIYSTQMNKRHFGIEEIAETLRQHSDEELKEQLIKKLNGETSEFLTSLFTNQYGYNSKGQKTKKAVSLLSKYCYFLMEYQFPIYDSLVCAAYPVLIKENRLDLKYKNITDANFIEALSELNKTSGVKDFEKLDNLMWYTEKKKNKSYSLILSKEGFLKRNQIE